MKKTVGYFAWLLLSVAACHQNPNQPTAASAPPLLAYFEPMPTADTIHLELSPTEDAEMPGDTIPSDLFFSSLDSAWRQAVEHVATPGEAIIHAHARYPLANGYEAIIVEVHQNWFKHHSLLVYDQQRQAFTDRQTVAEWYGGESGQVLVGSWLFDYDGDGAKDLVIREIEHSTKMGDNGEAIESQTERGNLRLFKAGKFSPVSSADATSLVQRYPIRSVW